MRKWIFKDHINKSVREHSSGPWLPLSCTFSGSVSWPCRPWLQRGGVRWDLAWSSFEIAEWPLSAEWKEQQQQKKRCFLFQERVWLFRTGNNQSMKWWIYFHRETEETTNCQKRNTFHFIDGTLYNRNFCRFLVLEAIIFKPCLCLLTLFIWHILPLSSVSQKPVKGLLSGFFIKYFLIYSLLLVEILQCCFYYQILI